MFISYFSKWDWFKIYFVLFHKFIFKYKFSRKRKKFILFLLFIIILITVIDILENDKSSLLLGIFGILIILIAYIFLNPLFFLIRHSPKKSFSFYTIPSKKKQKKSNDSNYQMIDYKKDTILYSGRIYDLLLETKDHFSLVYNTKNKFPRYNFISIKKNHNNELLNEKFLQLVQPRCQNYLDLSNRKH